MAGVCDLLHEGHLAEGWTVDAATEAVWALDLPPTWQALGVEQGWSVAAYERFLVDGALGLVVRSRAQGEIQPG